MGTRQDWISVLTLTVLWAVSMTTWGYIRRRNHHAPSLWTIPPSKLFGAFLMVALLGFDFGFLTTFKVRAFLGDLLLVLIGANFGLAAAVFAFRLVSPFKTS
jgi:hypothetical protein